MNSLIFTIGQTIRDFRNNKGMTLGELAAKVNVSSSLISQLERGGVNLSISLLKSIADALEVPLFSLFDKEEDQGRRAFSFDDVKREKGGNYRKSPL